MCLTLKNLIAILFPFGRGVSHWTQPKMVSWEKLQEAYSKTKQKLFNFEFVFNSLKRHVVFHKSCSTWDYIYCNACAPQPLAACSFEKRQDVKWEKKIDCILYHFNYIFHRQWLWLWLRLYVKLYVYAKTHLVCGFTETSKSYRWTIWYFCSRGTRASPQRKISL